VITKSGNEIPIKKILTASAFAAALVMAFHLFFAAPSSQAQEDWQQQVAQALGKAGSGGGGVYRVGLPRTDIKATLDGVELKPGFALGGWLAFEKDGCSGNGHGRPLLTEDEVNPVMAKLLAGGVQVTALHHHLLRNRPFTMYMRVLGQGDPVKLATVLRDALAQSKTPMTAASPADTAPPAAARQRSPEISYSFSWHRTHKTGI
jgi:hypothetical protein